MKKEKSRYYTISVSIRTFWKVLVPLGLFLCTAGGLAGFLAVDKYVMPKVVGVQRDMVATPNVLGMAKEDARNKFFGVGLLTEERGREFDDSLPEGAIISQFPDPGEMVKKGRKIALTVSRGPEAAKIPQVRGMTERQARQELRKGGFSVGNNVKRTFSATLPLDAVIETFPPAETVTSRAMDVDLVVSRGPKPTHAEVPNVIGESLSEAKKKLDEAGLKVGKVTYQNNPSLVPGTVVSQSSSPGTRVPLESTMDIVISAIR